MNTENTRWFSGELQYEGYPLHLRFPEKPDFDTLEKRFPIFLSITLIFSKLNNRGDPETDYNFSLRELDNDLVSCFEKTNHGKTVLVETYCGERTFYIYVDSESSIAEQRKWISETYKDHDLKWSFYEDKNWEFIREYALEFKFY